MNISGGIKVSGGLAYINNYPVTPGATYAVSVGAGGSGGNWIKNTAPITNLASGGGGGSAVRILWPGTTRRFPNTCVGNP